MGRKKGTPKTGGRKKGSTNKVTRELREMISEFLKNNFDTVMKEWESMEGRDKLIFYKELIQYDTPKKQAVSMDADINFNIMSEGELDAIADRLLNNKKHGENN